MYNLETGELVTYKAGPNRVDTHYDHAQAPCQRGEVCPKESPEKAHLHTLSDKNWRTLMIYRRGRAIGFDRMLIDDLLADNLAIIDGMFRSWERGRVAEASGTNFALQLIPFMLKKR